MSRLLLLFFGFLALYAAGDWALPLIDRDEPRFAEASREMLERGDFIVPFCDNLPRYDKPPLIYWLQDGAYELLGENGLAARLPSGLCGALATVIVAVWGAQLYDSRRGWRAAIIFGLSAQVLVHAHAAVADMAMIAASTASAWAGWNWLITGGQRRGWWLAFWVLLAIGFLAKGPIAWVPIGMTAWTARRMPRRPGLAQWILGLLLTVALVGIWGIPALARTHGQYAAIGLGRHVVMRSVGPLQGHGAKTWRAYALTLPFYFVTIWPSFFPWSLWLPAATLRLWRQRDQWRPEDTYLVTGTVLMFGIFTLSWTKLPHYTLPAFPFMALLMAARWQPQWEKPFRVAAAAMAACALAIAVAVLPLARRYFVSDQLYQAAAPMVSPAMEMAAVGYDEPSLVWLFRAKMRGFAVPMDAQKVGKWMKKSGPRICIIPVSEVKSAFPDMDPKWHVVEARGFNVANAHHEDLAAILKL